MISLKNLGMSYGARDLFNGVSLQLNEGVRYGITGANGSGKSTLLKLIAELSKRLRHADAALEDAHTLDLGGHLALRLLEEAGDGTSVTLTQTELARRIGASREKVNRKLHEWADEGWIAMGGAGIKLVSRDKLKALIQDARAN